MLVLVCLSRSWPPKLKGLYRNNEILKPIQRYGHGGAGSTAFKKLKTLLDRMMLRRTKVSLEETCVVFNFTQNVRLSEPTTSNCRPVRYWSDATIVGAPCCPDASVLLSLPTVTEEEEELYTSLYSDIKRNFDTYLDAGTVL